MKTFSMLFLMLLIPVSSFAESNGVPPPPMPDYMKKHRITNPPPAPKLNSKAQSQEVVEAKEPAKKLGKFLVEDSEELTILQKKTTAEHFNQNSEEVKNEFLDAAGDDESPEEVVVEEVESNSSVSNNESDIDDEAPLVAAEEPAPPVEEVSAVEVSEPEFEQAGMGDQALESAQEQYADVPTEESGEASQPLEEVESTLELSGNEAEEKFLDKRKPSSKKKFKSGMYKFAKNVQTHGVIKTK